MGAGTQAKVSGNGSAWVRAVANLIVDGGAMPPSRQTLYKQAPRHVDGGFVPEDGGGASARGDGRSTAALNGLPQSNIAAGQRIWVDAVIDDLVAQGAVTEDAGQLRWARDLHRDMTVTFQGKPIRIITPEERQRAGELGAVDVAIRGAGHLNRVLIAEGGGISGNPRYRAGERVALEVHPLAYELPAMSDAELDRLAKDVKKNGIVVPLVLVPDHDDPLRKQTAKPGEQPLVLDKDGNAIPKLKVGDGRHRLFLASQYNLPVRLEAFEGSEQQARERIVSLNLMRRMLHPTQIVALVRKVLLPAEKAKAEERRREGNRKGGEGGKSMWNSASTSDAPKGNGLAEKRVLEALGNPVSVDALRSAKDLDDAPETTEKAIRGKYRSGAQMRRDAIKEKAEREGRPVPEKVPPKGKTRGDRYSSALYELRNARREFDPKFKGTQTSRDRVQRLQQIVNEALELLKLERGTK